MPTATFDIILPCYNPLPGWQRTVSTSYRNLLRRHPAAQIQLIIVNDGSTTHTWHDGLADLKSTLPEIKIVECSENHGKGHALREGIALSSAPYCIFTDIDFPYSDASFDKVLRRLQTVKCDVVIGQRPESYYTNVPLPRLILSKGFRLFLKFIYGLKFRDSQCGIKGFNQNGRRTFLATETNRYLVDLEFLLIASSRKQSIEAVLVELRPGIVFSKLSLAAIAREMISLLTILYRVFVTRLAVP